MDVRTKTYRMIRDYAYILIGAAITGVSFNVFLLPNKIAAGGVSGISTICNHMVLKQRMYSGLLIFLYLLPVSFCSAGNLDLRRLRVLFFCRLLCF